MADNAVASGPVRETSAVAAESADGSNAVPTLVTKEPPASTTSETAVAGLAASTRTPVAACAGSPLEPAGDAGTFASHPAKILDPRFSSVGVAAVRSGKMWVYVTAFLN